MSVNAARLFLLAFWLGAAILFSVVVAPVSFSVLRASVPNADQLAGTIVSRTLSVINTSGFFISVLVLLTAFIGRRAGSARWFWLELILLVTIAIMTGLGRWVIASKMLTLRESMMPGPVGAEDSRRIAFDTLHRYSVAALSIAMLAALLASFITALRARQD